MRIEQTPFSPPQSDCTQNMNCRSRTTVKSKRLAPEKLSDRLRGKSILIYPREQIPDCLKFNPRKFGGKSTPVFNAIMALGTERSSGTYSRYITGHSDHEQIFMSWISRVPRDVLRFPRVGHIRGKGSNGTRIDPDEASSSKCNLHTALYIMARSNRYVYIRDKSPLFSLVSIDRKIQIIFVSEGG